MGLLEGKKALIFGVANDHSIAWGIARAFHEQGATVGFSSIESLIERRVKPLADSIGATFVEACDVQDDAQIAHVFERWREVHGELDILVHALAFARREDLDGAFVDTSRDGFATALDVSAYSLVALTRAALPLMTAGSSILTLSYYGAEKVVANYNVMGVAKAALEACVRYLAADLGPRGIRVNAISAGPVRTLSASGIAGFRGMYGEFRDVAPLRRNVDIADVGGAAVYLSSDMAAAVTGEVHYVDAGLQRAGGPDHRRLTPSPAARGIPPGSAVAADDPAADMAKRPRRATKRPKEPPLLRRSIGKPSDRPPSALRLPGPVRGPFGQDEMYLRARGGSTGLIHEIRASAEVVHGPSPKWATTLTLEAACYQPSVPGSPLNGPTISAVTQPP